MIAEETRTPIRQLSLQYPAMTIEDAYEVQRVLVEGKLARGRRLTGRKIGLTSRAMQQSVSITEPDYGALFDDMFFESGSEVPFHRFIRPRVEVELAFVLGASLRGPGCTVFDVLRATEFVTPALEILDARVQMTDPETGHLAPSSTPSPTTQPTPGWCWAAAVKPLDVDLRWVSALLYRNGVIEESGVAAAVLDHPANGVAWLANKLAAYGVALESGLVIMAGSFTRAVQAGAGDVFHADYGPLGAITCRFSKTDGP